MQTAIFVPDIHAPFHDEKAVRLVLKVIEALRPEKVILLGDVADFYTVSKYRKKPTVNVSLKDEMTSLREVLERFATVGAGSELVLCEGNHETRLARHLIDNAPQVYGVVELFDMVDPENRWRIVPYGTHTKIGPWLVSHDFGRSGKNAARASLDDNWVGCIFGHTHHMAYHAVSTVDGRLVTGATLGWLGDPNAVPFEREPAARKRVWQHGFGVGYFGRGHRGTWGHLAPVTIDRCYRCVVNGQLFSL